MRQSSRFKVLGQAFRRDVQIWHCPLREGKEKDGPVSLASLPKISKHLLLASKTSGKEVTGKQFDPGYFNEILVKEDLSLKRQLFLITALLHETLAFP